MPVEIFSKEQFERALPFHRDTNEPLWRHVGIVKGEHCYRLNFGSPHAEIFIRSSVSGSGVSRECGEDSIRLYLCDATDTSGSPAPLAKKLQKYTTRVKGWQQRLMSQLHKQAEIGILLQPCPKCGKMMKIVKIGKGPDAGKMAISCTAKDENDKFLNHSFTIIKDDEEEGGEQQEEVPVCPTCNKLCRKVDIRNGSNAGKQAWTCSEKVEGKWVSHVFQVIESE